MDKVYVVGVGMTKIGRFYDRSGRELFVEALLKAIDDAGGLKPKALVVGNMTSSVLMEQDSLAALLADHSGLRGVPAFKVEAACGSGGAAFYAGYSLVKSGLADVVAVGGLEKLTENLTSVVTKALAQAADAEHELFYGVSFTGLNAMVARLYMNKFNYTREDFAYWALRMHEYASYNPYAQLPRKTTLETILKSPVVADPLHLFDCSPIGDGAAVTILVRGEEKAKEIAKTMGRDVLVEVKGAALATDSVDLGSRNNLLALESTIKASREAYKMAGIKAKDIDYVEVHDAFHITGYLALEDMGFAPKGEAPKLWREGRFGKGDKPEVNFSGGLKARGHPVGATGVYQIVESTMQLRGDFPGYKASDPEIAATQNIGGVGTYTTVTVLKRT
ncbi:thiolase domain-containing protein [Staphylothermus hellenicus]|uniref:Thiolase n=1 Tax=Staphylothermus hellenicus (strain DSM 12710 / JCM 10830 / BK20S6-10-b1 / P8) TaxID=591019 RepID=D7D8N3_STAHD|nr:thiolase domain-containing protein [Staphylothermus hellenicus]ADI32129.1 Thiolase [Staphylothermus hellenicus DSM 12710]